MTEFSFAVKLSYRDPLAFIDEDLERVHDRLNRRLFEALAAEFEVRPGDVDLETEPM
jgi:hypothetical protein